MFENGATGVNRCKAADVMGFDPRRYEREMREAQRKAEAAAKREVDRVNREIAAHNRKVEQANKKAVDDYNREVDRANRENKRRVDQYNREAQQHNRQVEEQNRRAAEAHNRQIAAANRHNAKVIAELNQRLRAAESGPRYTEAELTLADRLQAALPAADQREVDTFLSYARIDGVEVGAELRERLEGFEVTVWFDEVSIEPGKSQARQMDMGLQKARAGIALLTPAYLAGRFWTERELGALLHKETLIPVLHGVSFEDVAEYSGILPDLAGFETARDSVEVIAEKIAAAVLGGGEQ